MKQILTCLLILTNSFLTHAVNENKELSVPTKSLNNQEPSSVELDNFDREESNRQASDTLTFVQTKRNKKVTMRKGMRIEVQTYDKELITGVFIRTSNDKIELKQTERAIAIAVTAIKQITVYSNSNVMTGVLGLVIGTSSFTSLSLGGVALIGGIAALKNSIVLGVGLISVSAPLIYYGLKLYFMLKKADRRKIKLNKGWTIASQSGG